MTIQFIINNWYLFLALVVILALLAAGWITPLIHGIKTLSPSEAVRLINREGGAIVDVSETAEFKDGHIPNAISAPLSKLGEHLKPLEKYREKPVVVSCRSGNRSIKGAVKLRKHGFAAVYSLAGGMVAWERDNLPVERGVSGSGK